MTTGMVFLVLSVLLVLAAISLPARKFFKSFGLWGEAQANKASDALLNADPLGVLKVQIDNAAQNAKQAQQVLQVAAKQVISLQKQINDGKHDQQVLTNRINTALSHNDVNNTARFYALELARVEDHLKVNENQLLIAEKQYNDNLELVKKFEQQIVDARKEISDLGYQLAQSQAEKNLQEMTASLKNKLNVGDLSDARKRVQDQIDANRGASKAAYDLNSDELAQQKDLNFERDIAADEILARFRNKQS